MALIISILIDYRNLRYGFLILKQDLEKILSEYLIARESDGKTSNPLLILLQKNLPKILRNI